MTLKEIFDNYDVVRDLEINYDNHNNKILVYEYMSHTQDEESGEFLGEFDYEDFCSEYEQRGYARDVDSIIEII